MQQRWYVALVRLFLDAATSFSGDEIPGLGDRTVDVLSNPGGDARDRVIAQVGEWATQCVQFAKTQREQGKAGYGYIGVWATQLSSRRKSPSGDTGQTPNQTTQKTGEIDEASLHYYDYRQHYGS